MTSEILNQHIRLAPDVMARTVGNELFILNVKTERYYGLDEIGSRLFALFTQGASVGEALVQMQAEYAVDSETLSNDIGRLLEELAQHQLIEAVAAQEK